MVAEVPAIIKGMVTATEDTTVKPIPNIVVLAAATDTKIPTAIDMYWIDAAANIDFIIRMVHIARQSLVEEFVQASVIIMVD